MRLLILGGTTEASALARQIARTVETSTAILSLAGRTRNPVTPPIPFRIGGFGGVDGLRDLPASSSRIDAVVDATHPFAAQMSANAAAACHGCWGAARRLHAAALARTGWGQMGQGGQRGCRGQRAG